MLTSVIENFEVIVLSFYLLSIPFHAEPVAPVFRRSTTQPTTDQVKGNIGQYRAVKSSKVIAQDSEHIIVTV